MAAEIIQKIPYQVVNNYKFPKTFSTECILSTIQYKPRNDDIFLSTFPRCGTTWAQQILYLIFHEGIPPKDGKDLLKFSPYMELMGAETALNASRPCVLKVHLPFHLIPYLPDSKYIYVARNPKDCCVSFYNFLTKTTSNIEIEFDEFFEYFITGDLPYENYFDHVLSWYHHRNDSNVLFITYEEMKCNFSNVVKNFCTFLGGKYSALINNEVILENIFRYSSFNFMKNTTNINIKNIVHSNEDKDLGSLNEVWNRRDKSNLNLQFVRKGEIGDWKNYFSSSTNQKMDQVIQNKFGNTELLEIWKDFL